MLEGDFWDGIRSELTAILMEKRAYDHVTLLLELDCTSLQSKRSNRTMRVAALKNYLRDEVCARLGLRGELAEILLRLDSPTSSLSATGLCQTAASLAARRNIRGYLDSREYLGGRSKAHELLDSVRDQLADLEHECLPTRPGMTKARFLSWDDFDELADRIVAKIVENTIGPDQRPGAVVGISRGGFPLATRLSHLLRCRAVGAVSIWKHNSETPHDVAVDGPSIVGEAWPEPLNDTILLVDDIIGDGDTMRAVIAAAEIHYRRTHPALNLIPTALYLDSRTATSDPDDPLSRVVYGAKVSSNAKTWIVFPWESTEIDLDRAARFDDRVEQGVAVDDEHS